MADGTEIYQTFSQLVATHERGQLNQDLSDMMRDVIAELHNFNAEMRKPAKGKITLTFDFTVEEGIVTTMAAIKDVTPPKPRMKRMYWATPENNLTTADPKQQRLPFHDVNDKREAQPVA